MKEEKKNGWKEKKEEIIQSLLGWILPVLGFVLSLIILSSIIPLLKAAWKSYVPAESSYTPQLLTPHTPPSPAWKEFSLSTNFTKIWTGDGKCTLERTDRISIALELRLDGRKRVIFPASSHGEVYQEAINILPEILYTRSIEARVLDPNHTNKVNIIVTPRE